MDKVLSFWLKLCLLELNGDASHIRYKVIAHNLIG